MCIERDLLTLNAESHLCTCMRGREYARLQMQSWGSANLFFGETHASIASPSGVQHLFTVK